MKKDDFKKAMSSLNVERNDIEEKMRKAQQEYIDSYPIKEGDVCIDGTGRKCWFKSLKFTLVSSDEAVAIVNYPKKDGERSNRDIHVYGELRKSEE